MHVHDITIVIFSRQATDKAQVALINTENLVQSLTDKLAEGKLSEEKYKRCVRIVDIINTYMYGFMLILSSNFNY